MKILIKALKIIGLALLMFFLLLIGWWFIPERTPGFENEVPLVFIAGRHDYTTPWVLIEQYYQEISAPTKELIFFENSAHFPFFEEPRKFSRVITESLQGID